MKSDKDNPPAKKCGSDNSLAVGGQAVIEGVMIRSPYAVATAVRRADGQIEIDAFPYTSLTKRSAILGAPVIRGAIVLGEALYLGLKTLNWSAERYAEDENGNSAKPKKSKFWDKILAFLSILAALALGLGLFMYIPYWISGLMKDAGGSQFVFHGIAGAIRIIIFLLYIYVISLWKEIHRVFEYHGAEHKSIFAYEKNGQADAEKASAESRFHPRCGTSFLLITAIVVIFLFAVLDSILIPLIGEYHSPLHRLLVHLPFIPVVAGVSYEVLKFSGKRSEGRFWGMVVKPGLWLQHLTTREPDAEQIEVAAAAIKASLETGKIE